MKIIAAILIVTTIVAAQDIYNKTEIYDAGVTDSTVTITYRQSSGIRDDDGNKIIPDRIVQKIYIIKKGKIALDTTKIGIIKTEKSEKLYWTK